MLKSREMKEGWMKNYEGWWRMNEEWWRMNEEWWKMIISSCWGVLLTDGQTDGRTDICDCRVAFATEKVKVSSKCFRFNLYDIQLE